MKINFSTKEELALYYAFKIESKLDVVRLDTAWDYYINQYRGSGMYGCIAEVLSRSKGSKKIGVAKQGENDIPILIRYPSGVVAPRPAERKTTGGRIDGLLAKGANEWIVYSMDICNSGTSNLRRTVPPTIYRTETFIEGLQLCGAIKYMRHNHIIDGLGIQASSKKFWVWCLENGISYDRNKAYTLDELNSI